MRCLAFVTALALATPACGGKADAPPPPEVSPAVDTAPPVAESPVTEARATLAAPLAGPDALSAALATAEALVTWADAHADHPDAAEARLLATRTRLLVAEAGPAVDRPRMLRAAIEQADALARQGARTDGLDPAHLAATARAILSLHGDLEEGAIPPHEALALASGADAASTAVRAAWLGTAQAAIAALREAPSHQRLEILATRAGRLLCVGCAEAHQLSPDSVERFLLEDANGHGLVCDAALAGAADAVTAADRARLLLGCEDLRPEGPAEAALGAGANALSVALLRRAGRLLALPEVEGPLAPVVAARRAALVEALAAPLLLPVPVLTAAGTDGDAGADTPSTVPASLDGLGFGGLTVVHPALEVIVVGPDGVRAGLRPTVALRDGEGVVSLSARAAAAGDTGPHLDGPAVITLEALRDAKRDPDTGAVTELVDAARAVRASADAHVGTTEGPRVAELVVDAAAPSDAVVAALDSLIAAGVEAFRFTKTSTHGRVLPLWVREPPAEHPAAVAPGFDEPIVVHVTPGHIDVWGPDKPRDPAPEGASGARPPAAAETGYRGTRLSRLRVPVAASQRGELGAETLARVNEAIAYWRQVSGHGPLIHVVGDDESAAADVLRVARTYQEGDGATLAGLDGLWPGASCLAEQIGGAANPCASGVAVAFSRIAVPSSRGITPTPREREAKPVAAAPSAEFCNDRDIKANMTRQARDFRFCYESQLRLDETLEGRVPVVFTIGLDGSVQSVTISQSTLKNDKVHACLRRAVQQIKFGRPDGGVCIVRWPFVFQPR